MIDDCGPCIDGAWVLPDYAHVPGTTVRPEGGVVSRMADAADVRTDPSAWQTNKAYLYGFMLYRGGFYWEAHEVWEAVWMGCRPNSPERHLLQALIQLANAALKERLAKDNAVRRLVVDAGRHLDEAISRVDPDGDACSLMGVDLKRLRACIDEKIFAL